MKFIGPEARPPDCQKSFRVTAEDSFYQNRYPNRIAPDGCPDLVACYELLLRLHRFWFRGGADLVLGSRTLEFAPDPPQTALQLLGNRLLTRAISTVLGRPLSDVSSGYRAFSRRAIHTMQLFADFTYTHESLVSCALSGLRIEELPVHSRGVRPFGSSRIAKSWLRYGLRSSLIIAGSFARHASPLPGPRRPIRDGAQS